MTGEWQDGRALLAVFELLGPEYAMVRSYRSELSGLIN